LAKSVVPPLIQCRMWWAWVHAGGRLQPGKAHPWSRAINARRWCAETNGGAVSGGAGGGVCGGCLVGGGVILVVLTGGGEVFVADE